MTDKPDAHQISEALLAGITMLVRRVRQVQVDDELSLHENSALKRLNRAGPATPSALARLEQITPQSMGRTVAGLEARGLIERRPDAQDGRRVVLSLTEAGRQALLTRRNTRIETIAAALSSDFTGPEQEQLMAAARLIERLAEGL
ncbi:MarR family transcriptional regulator [Actinoallomurus sp. NPDC050550]|uniref:MarR family winged helix-turn-helix transcriptional regulator n=1 Tax=Actinoallomurus sp. NPDC050550 TaxID=3154937 RepID=UPI0033DFEF0D